MQVNELVFSSDFHVLEIENEGSSMPRPFLLGKPFMKTAKTKINFYNRTLIMELDGKIVCFNIFEAMRYPSDLNVCFAIDTLDTLEQQDRKSVV